MQALAGCLVGGARSRHRAGQDRMHVAGRRRAAKAATRSPRAPPTACKRRGAQRRPGGSSRHARPRRADHRPPRSSSGRQRRAAGRRHRELHASAVIATKAAPRPCRARRSCATEVQAVHTCRATRCAWTPAGNGRHRLQRRARRQLIASSSSSSTDPLHPSRTPKDPHELPARPLRTEQPPARTCSVIGNNIANANTFGAKVARAEFSDMYAMALQ